MLEWLTAVVDNTLDVIGNAASSTADVAQATAENAADVGSKLPGRVAGEAASKLPGVPDPNPGLSRLGAGIALAGAAVALAVIAAKRG